MRKVMLSLVVVLAVWKATSWTPTPQWRTILAVHGQGTEPFSNGLVFTPERQTAYRLTMGCSATGNAASGWDFTFNWKDMTGIRAMTDINCEPVVYTQAQEKLFVFTPKVGMPVTLTGTRGEGPSTYYGFYTVEELQ